MASTIIEANPDLSDVLIFEGGEAVRIPIVETVETPETMPPWRRFHKWLWVLGWGACGMALAILWPEKKQQTPS